MVTARDVIARGDLTDRIGRAVIDLRVQCPKVNLEKMASA